MKLDKRAADAVRKAAKEAGQPKELAPKIIAWLEALASGESSNDTSERHLKLLYDSTVVPGESEKAEK